MGTMQQHLTAVHVGHSHDAADAAFERVKQRAREFQTLAETEDMESLLVRVPGVINFGVTYLLAPDGSKEWWSTSDNGDALRAVFIEEMSRFGEVVTVQWGEMGLKVSSAVRPS